MEELPFEKAVDLLREHFGTSPQIIEVNSLCQWGEPKAHRLSLKWAPEGQGLPSGVIMKGPREGYDPSDLGLWRPGWRIAQDVVNLRFLQEVGAGGYVPDLYGFDMDLGFILMEDFGDRTLHQVLGEGRCGSAREILFRVAEALGRLHGAILPRSREFPAFAERHMPRFAPLTAILELDPDDPYSLLGLHRHFGDSELPSLETQAEDFSQYFREAHSFSGHVLGDLWHEHVLLPDKQVRFVDFHCAGRASILEDVMRLLDGTPLYEIRRLPRDIVREAKSIYLAALVEALRWDLTHDLRDEFQKSYAATLVAHCFSICSREWVHLQRDRRATWRLVREAMATARQVLGSSLAEFTALIELASGIQVWFEANRPESRDGPRQPYDAFS